MYNQQQVFNAAVIAAIAGTIFGGFVKKTTHEKRIRTQQNYINQCLMQIQAYEQFIKDLSSGVAAEDAAKRYHETGDFFEIVKFYL